MERGGQGAQGLAWDSTHWPSRLHWLNNNNNNNNNNGNFICVFECSLRIARQFTNAACHWIINKTKQKQKQRNQNCIRSGLSQFLFLQQKM